MLARMEMASMFDNDLFGGLDLEDINIPSLPFQGMHFDTDLADEADKSDMTPQCLPVIDPHFVREALLEERVVEGVSGAQLPLDQVLEEYLARCEVAQHYSRLHILVCGCCHSVFHVLDEFLGEVDQEQITRRIESKWFRLSRKTKMGWERAAKVLSNIHEVGKRMFDTEMDGNSDMVGSKELWPGPLDFCEADEINAGLGEERSSDMPVKLEVEDMVAECEDLDHSKNTGQITRNLDITSIEQSIEISTSVESNNNSENFADNEGFLNETEVPVSVVSEQQIESTPAYDGNYTKTLSSPAVESVSKTFSIDTISNQALVETGVKRPKRVAHLAMSRNKRGRWESPGGSPASDRTWSCPLCSFCTVTEWKLQRHLNSNKHQLKEKRPVDREQKVVEVVDRNEITVQDVEMESSNIRAEENVNSTFLDVNRDGDKVVFDVMDREINGIQVLSSDNETVQKVDVGNKAFQGVDSDIKAAQRVDVGNTALQDVDSVAKNYKCVDIENVAFLQDADRTDIAFQGVDTHNRTVQDVGRDDKVFQGVDRHCRSFPGVNKDNLSQSGLEKDNRGLDNVEGEPVLTETQTHSSVKIDSNAKCSDMQLSSLHKSVGEPGRKKWSGLVKKRQAVTLRTENVRSVIKRKSAIAATEKVSLWTSGKLLDEYI